MENKYRIGDIFKCSEPTHKRVRLRVRDIEMQDHWDEPQYALQLYSTLRYCADNPSKSLWGWHDKRQDQHCVGSKIKERGLELVSRGKKPAPVQMSLFSD